MAIITIEPLPLLKDNYAWLLIEPSTQRVAVVDPSEAAPVIEVLTKRGLPLHMVINTHHHWDHVGGNQELKAHFNCQVVGPAYDQYRLKGLDRGVSDGDTVMVGDASASVIYIPGHTMGHIALYFVESRAVFVGDTMFSMGCGRLFEGTPADMKRSFERLGALPPETNIYCGHEYTEANARFALHVDPDNEAVKERAREVQALRQEGKPTVPSTLATELATNPFLRAPDVATFARLRTLKDSF